MIKFLSRNLSNRTITKTSLEHIVKTRPGVFLFPKEENVNPDAKEIGPFQVWEKGTLSSYATNDTWHVFFEGNIIANKDQDLSDAEFILQFFLDNGCTGIQQIEGYYNIIIINNDGSDGYSISDTLSSRIQYIYQFESKLGIFPFPIMLNYTKLSCSVNRLSLYEQLKTLHSGYNHTFCNELERVLPGHIYRFGKSGKINKISSVPFKQNIDESITFEEGTKWMHSICKDAIESTITHPKLKELDVELPLTAGLDSRHILGQLLNSTKKPSKLRHIRLIDEDYKPVKLMSDELGIPLNAPSFYELNFKKLLKLWIERTSGLINVHQFYFLNLTQDIPKEGVISFNGYLMDKFLGFAPLIKPETDDELFTYIRKKRYSGKSVLGSLFSDSSELENQLMDYYKTHISNFEGEALYKAGIHEMFTRGLHYTAIVDSILSDDVYSFSPGATNQSLQFFSSISREIAGKKRVHLNAMKEYFPEVSHFPDSDGIPLLDKKERPRTSESPFSKHFMPLMNYFFSGFSDDPAPNTEHAWLRQSKFMHDIHKKVIYDGYLFRDGILSQSAAKISWNLHKIGGYQAWTLMSILSAEVSYQLLVKKIDPNTIYDWLVCNE